MSETMTPAEYRRQEQTAKFLQFLELWRQSGRGLSSVGELLPLAEQCGLYLGRATTLRGRQTNLGRLLNSIPGAVFESELWVFEFGFHDVLVRGRAAYWLAAKPRDSPS